MTSRRGRPPPQPVTQLERVQSAAFTVRAAVDAFEEWAQAGELGATHALEEVCGVAAEHYLHLARGRRPRRV